MINFVKMYSVMIKIDAFIYIYKGHEVYLVGYKIGHFFFILFFMSYDDALTNWHTYF